jgi:hypothetical protein
MQGLSRFTFSVNQEFVEGSVSRDECSGGNKHQVKKVQALKLSDPEASPFIGLDFTHFL